MTKKTNLISIGIFVSLALVVAVSAIMIFGASSFSKTETAVCYFKNSVNGLSLGAPVKFKGVEVGKVKQIEVNLVQDNPTKSTVAVYLALFPSLDNDAKKNLVEILEAQREQGLRAKLNFQSIVTGMLYVELDYLAEVNEKYELSGTNNVIEIPVVESSLSDMVKKVGELLENISEIDFKQTVANLDKLITTSTAKLEEIDAKNLNARSLAILENVEKISKEGKFVNTIDSLNKLLVESQAFLETTSGSVKNFDKNLNETLGNINSLVEDANAMIAPNSSFRYELSLLLKNIGDASISIKVLADFIERNPNAFITGKYRPENK